MKSQILAILLLSLFSCYNSTSDKQGALEEIAVNESTKKISDTLQFENEEELDTVKLLKDKLSLNYIGNKKYKSDTIQLNEFKFIVSGWFLNLDLNDRYIFTLLDSITLIEPVHSILKSEEISGYLYKEKGYNFNSIIRLNDTNRDGLIDIEVYNSAKSGVGYNSTYDVFLNQSTKFEYSSDFSRANLRYDEETNTYTSRMRGGHVGKIYSITTYEYDGKSLIPIKTERQDVDYDKKVYIRTTTDLKTNVVKTEEIK